MISLLATLHSPKTKLASAEIRPKVAICLELSDYALTKGFTNSNLYVILRA